MMDVKNKETGPPSGSSVPCVECQVSTPSCHRQTGWLCACGRLEEEAPFVGYALVSELNLGNSQERRGGHVNLCSQACQSPIQHFSQECVIAIVV